jgi:hypothetical protein
MWGGEWISQWTFDYASKQLSGNIKLRNHYFESGNIQFNLHKEFASVAVKTTDGRGIVDAIKDVETKVSVDF